MKRRLLALCLLMGIMISGCGNAAQGGDSQESGTMMGTIPTESLRMALDSLIIIPIIIIYPFFYNHYDLIEQ